MTNSPDFIFAVDNKSYFGSTYFFETNKQTNPISTLQETHDYVRHICARWNVCSAIIKYSQVRATPDKEKKEGGNPAMLIPSTNIETHPPEPSERQDPERDKYWWADCKIRDSSGSFEEKLSKVQGILTPEV